MTLATLNDYLMIFYYKKNEVKKIPFFFQHFRDSENRKYRYFTPPQAIFTFLTIFTLHLRANEWSIFRGILQK